MTTEAMRPQTRSAPPPEPGSGRGPLAWGRLAWGPLAWVALALLVALIATATALGFALASANTDQAAQAQAAQAQSAQAQDAARDYALALSAVHYQTLEDSRARAAELSTAEFSGQVDEVFNGLASTLTAAQAVTTATVDDVGIVSLDEANAVALVFIDQQSTSLVRPEGVVNGLRLRVELVREGGRWLVDKAEFT